MSLKDKKNDLFVYKMRCRLTSFGYSFLLLIILMLAAGLNYNNSLVYLFVFVLLAMLIVALIRGWSNLFHLRLYQFESFPAFAGQKILISGSLVSVYGLQARCVRIDMGILQQKFCDDLIGDDLNGDSSFLFQIRFPTLPRGIHTIRDIYLQSTYPLGLFKWSLSVNGSQSVIVYPKPEQHILMKTQRSNAEQQLEHGDFDELANWQQGEGLSGICWKTYAKTGKKMKKQFSQLIQQQSQQQSQQQDSHPIVFDWQQLSALTDEQKLSQLCFQVLQQQGKGEPYALNLPEQSIEAASGAQHDSRCLKALAQY